MEFEELIKERFSTRDFSSKKVEQEKIDMILEAGRIAPTAKNNQPIKIYVVTSDEGLNKIDKASPCRYGSPTVLLVCGDKENAFKKGDYSTYEMDASIVTTHMMLEATNIDINSVWVELFDKDVIREEFNIPENLIPVCLLPLGYKNDTCMPGPMHSIRKHIEEIVEYK